MEVGDVALPAGVGMKNYRNERLLELANECPQCCYCGQPKRDGEIVSAHFRSIKYGAGVGIKPHDIPCYLCTFCHDRADGRLTSPSDTKETKDLILYEGVYRSLLWLLQSGHLEVK